MASKKISRKQLLKEPDEFITFTGKLIQFYTQHQSQIIGGLAAFIILLASIAGYRYYTLRAEAQASFQLTRIKTTYEELSADGDAASAYAGIKADMEALMKTYGNRSSGKVAGIIMGDYSYQAGEYAAAREYYEKALGSFPAGSIYASRLLSSLAYTCLAEGDATKASSYFEKTVADTDALMKDEALFNLAILSSAADASPTTPSFWQQIVSDHEKSMYREIALEKSGEPDA